VHSQSGTVVLSLVTKPVGTQCRRVNLIAVQVLISIFNILNAMSTTLDDLKSKLEEATRRAGAADYFRACWEPLNGNYPQLQHFAGGLYTVFPGSLTIERDFSILMFEKSDHRTSNSDVCTEGFFHARIFEEVGQLQVDSKNGNFIFESEPRDRTPVMKRVKD
jgi:hypothetical protein